MRILFYLSVLYFLEFSITSGGDDDDDDDDNDDS